MDPDKLGFRPLRVEWAPYSWEEILFQDLNTCFLWCTSQVPEDFFPQIPASMFHRRVTRPY
jgi:hypothetical protein